MATVPEITDGKRTSQDAALPWIQRLPPELFENILVHASLETVRNLRLASKIDAQRCWGPRLKICFARQRVDLTASSLSRLVNIVARPHLNILVQELDIYYGDRLSGTCNYRYLMRQLSIIFGTLTSLSRLGLHTGDIPRSSTMVIAGSASRLLGIVLLLLVHTRLQVGHIDLFPHKPRPDDRERRGPQAYDLMEHALVIGMSQPSANASTTFSNVKRLDISFTTWMQSLRPYNPSPAYMYTGTGTNAFQLGPWHQTPLVLADTEGASRHNFEGLKTFIMHFPQLERLAIGFRNNQSGTAHGYEKIFEYIAAETKFPELRTFTLEGLRVNTIDLTRFLQRHPRLTHVRLAGIHLLTGTWPLVLAGLRKSNTCLQSLELEDILQVDKHIFNLAPAENKAMGGVGHTPPGDVASGSSGTEYMLPVFGGHIQCRRVFGRQELKKGVAAFHTSRKGKASRPKGSKQLRQWFERRAMRYGPI